MADALNRTRVPKVAMLLIADLIVWVSPYAMQALVERRPSCSFGHPFFRGLCEGQQHDRLIQEVHIKRIGNGKP